MATCCYFRIWLLERSSKAVFEGELDSGGAKLTLRNAGFSADQVSIFL